MLYTRLKRRNANDIERLFKVCAVLHNMVLAYDPVGAGPRDFEMYMRHLHAERELDDRADLSSEDAPRLSVDNPASLRRACNVPVAAQNASRADDAPARSRLKRKRDLQETLITHFQHFKKMHKRQYGVEPFAYARTRDKHLAMLAGA